MQESSGLAVVIINYNGESDLPELLESLSRQTLSRFEILLVDNNSSDDSLSFMGRHYPQVRVWAERENLGYARAANLAMDRLPCEYIVFLNTDVKLDRRCLQELKAVADSDPTIACAGCKMRLYHQPKILNGVGGSMNYLGYTWDRGMFEEDQGQYDTVDDVLFACGGAALFRRRPFLAAGGYDEGLYMYHEDVDLCWRFWLLGHRVVTAPDSIVYHHFSHSTRTNRSMKWREHIGERNSIRSMVKNYEWKNLCCALSDMSRLPQQPGRKKVQRENFAWNLERLPETLLLRFRIQQRRVRSDGDLAYLVDPCAEVPVDVSAFAPQDFG